jgi:hypothetical protein
VYRPYCHCPSGVNVGSTITQEMSYGHPRARSPPPVPPRATQVTSTPEGPLPQLWTSLPPENRQRLSQLMARVIARHRLPRQQEVPDD